MKTRSEEEMLALITGFAESDDRIRVVLMNGSRVDSSAEKDVFRDYDILNLVTDLEPFRDEKYVTAHFGEAIVIQKPEDMEWPPPSNDGGYIYLMQLADGNRIDLSFAPIETLDDRLHDSLTRVLLDKDGIVPDLPPPSEKSYFIAEPTEKLYADCCNEFFCGLGSHIPKSLWRKQLPLLKHYIELVLCRPLVMMLGWEIGTRTGFDKSLGKAGNNLEKFLTPDQWRQYQQTYADADFDNIWESLKIFNNLFNQSAEAVGQAYNFPYPKETGEKAWAFLEHVRNLPEDAQSIYE